MKGLISVALLTASFSCATQAATLFSDDFEDHDANGWTLVGNAQTSGTQAIGNYALRLKQTASATTSVDASGHSAVTITMHLAATGLESGDNCYAEFSTDGGSNWTTLVHLVDGQDDATFHNASASPTEAEDNADLRLRFRSTGNLLGDYCWGDNVTVTGTAGGVTPKPQLSVSGATHLGSVDLGDSAQSALSLSNAGTADLNLGTLSALASPFALASDACSGQTLAPGADCAVTAQFSPNATGYQSASLSIPSNDANSPLTLTLSGTGVEPGSVVDDFDPLSGSGAVSRSLLSYATLTGGSAALVATDGYALPAEAAHPSNQFEGRLELFGEASGGSFDEHKDSFRYTGNGDTTRKHLPEFDFEFVQTGSHLVPTQRGNIPASHPEWEYILEPGRVWDENGDNGYSRAVLPFTLHQKNANCQHNGLMSFLFKDDGSVSKVSYQIASETCLYFQFDMWGLLDASYTPQAVAGASTLKADHQAEEAGRLPTKPISALATDHPGADPSQFGSAAETDPAYMTLFGFVIDGVNYVGGCQTRQGPHPYCHRITVPSYSTAKTVFAGAALMRLEKLYSGVKDEPIADYVSDCAADGNWGDVRLEDNLDMGTGNYNLSGYMSDEGASHTNDLFLPEDHASKIAYSCTEYSRKAQPGTRWVYHTSDTYILGTAMDAYLKQQQGSSADLFDDLVVQDLYAPLGLSPAAKVSRRTYDAKAQPFAGWGLTFLQDDVAKLAKFLADDDGTIGGQAMFDSALFEAAMQRDGSDRGLDPLTDYKYNNGFWAHEVKAKVGCSSDTWVPFMSGYGGISVLLLPNGTAYYVFSDNDTYLWSMAAAESNRIRPYCQ
ncbi:choice-of-anchor D domain-containing protein [Ferrimonas balearica]|uniref:choice-of-anchor D domain-containing protein n=1 Tax=Ferrimonas balearica TaxID=44012 RepID=UPI001C99D3AC|nr:choice-of-anchor D domain-containing protein [Ferrimonas balearica]MBY5992226.1 choice-of-anchor D domain-containing protein [Ferrimonas balearica]